MRASEEVQGLLEELRRAAAYDLEQPRYFGSPTFAAHSPGYLYTLHRRHEAGLGETRTSASGLIVTTDHAGTHIDALCHQAESLELHGGRRIDPSLQTPTGFTELGAESIPPLIGRGVLLDVARHLEVDRLAPEQAVVARELEETAEHQDVSIREGDVVLVRTGNGAVWAERELYERGPGLAPDASRWLSDRAPLAVGADNLAWDVVGLRDPELGTLPGHVVLLVRAGVYILENLFLEELGRAACREFVFVGLPLKLCGATGSPIRPLALVAGNTLDD